MDTAIANRLDDLVDHLDKLLGGRMTHLNMSLDSIMVVFSWADLVRLGIHGYMVEFERFGNF